MVGFPKKDAVEIAKHVGDARIKRTTQPEDVGGAHKQCLVKPFRLTEDLESGDSATAKLQIPGLPGSFSDASPDPDPAIKIYAGQMPAGKKIPSGTHVFAAYYGAWYVISSWACLEDIEEEE